MTMPLILLAIGSVAAGGFLIVGQTGSRTSSPRSSAPAEAAHRLITLPGIVTLVAGRRAGSALAWASTAGVPVPAVRPRAARLPTVAARKDLYGDALNESLLMRPGQWLTRLTVFFDSRGVDGLVNGARGARRRHVRPGAAGADRLRPLVRPVHVLRRRAVVGRPAPGEALDAQLSLADRPHRHARWSGRARWSRLPAEGQGRAGQARRAGSSPLVVAVLTRSRA